MKFNERIEKVSSEGEPWVKRKREKQLKEDQKRNSLEIFGANLLSLHETMNGEGKFFEEQKTIFKNDFYLSRLKESCGATYKTELKTFQENMVFLAKKRPTDFKKLLLNYFENNTEKIDFLSQKIGYSQDEDESFRESYISSLSQEYPTLPSKEMDKKIAVKELVEFITLSYAAGEMVLDEDLLIYTLEYHRTKLLTTEVEIQKEIVEFKEKIQSLLINAIKEGKFNIRADILKERLGVIQFKIIDSIIAKLGEMYGDYSGDTHIIRLSSDLPKDLRWKVFAHEIFHALSGQIENMYIPESDAGSTSFTPIKVGFNFLPREKFNPKTMRTFESINLTWLNEALTEQAAIDLLETEDTTTYKKERELLEMLIESGIPREKLYDAYFENYDVTKKKGEHKLPKTKELFRIINEKLGSGFLVNLDKFIAFIDARSNPPQGVKQAIQTWKTKKDTFPEYLKNWVDSVDKKIL